MVRLRGWQRMARRRREPTPARSKADSASNFEEGATDAARLIEGVRDCAIFMLDPHGIVISWNPGAQRIKGYTAEEIVGRHFSTFYSAEDCNSGLPARALRIAEETGKFEGE